MTLKCKIKEISEIQTQNDFEKAAIQEQELSDFGEDLGDDDFQLQELGTIEQMHSTQKRPAKKNEREFYDKNSIGMKNSKKKDWVEFEQTYKKSPQKSQKRDERNVRGYDQKGYHKDD